MHSIANLHACGPRKVYFVGENGPVEQTKNLYAFINSL